MTLHQLKVFCTVVKLHSFTEAAKALHTSQPTVSTMIQELQNELGVKLFERLGNRRQLTEAGRRLFERVEKGLGIIEGIREEIDELKGLKKGRLTVGGSGFAGATLLPVVVQAFKKAFPSIEVKVMIQPSVVLEEKLLNGELDVALMGAAPKSRLIDAKPYREEEVVVIAPPNHPLARRRSIPLELLAQEAIVADGKGSHIREMVENIFAQKRLAFTPALEINVLFAGRDAIKTAVAHGLGIAFISKHHIALDVKAGQLQVLKIPDLKLRRVMYIAIHKGRQNSLAQSLVDFLRNYKEQ